VHLVGFIIRIVANKTTASWSDWPPSSRAVERSHLPQRHDTIYP